MSKIKNFKYYINEQITVDEFFVHYHNFPQGAFSTLTHKDIKSFLPFIKRKKNDEITKEEILTGKIILVRDVEGVVLGYVNPLTVSKVEEHIKKCENNSKVEVLISVDDDIDTFKDINIEELSDYELEQVLKTSKDNKEYKMVRLVQKELYFRPEHKHGQKQKKLEKVRKREIGKEDL